MTHPSTRPEAHARAHAGTTSAPLRRAAAGALCLPLLLVACGDDGQDGGTELQDSSPRAGGERLVDAAEAGMERASSFGFDQAGFVTEDAVAELRESTEAAQIDQQDEADVRPAECAEPLAAVDWAPLLLETDVARVDFGSETFTGTGSIEIAELEDQEAEQRAAEHVGHVEELIASCPEVEFTQMDLDYQLDVEPVELSDADGASSVAYSWTRSFAEDEGAADQDAAGDADETTQQPGDDGAAEGEDMAGGTTVAQILFTETEDDVVMVSFLGEPAAGSEEFTEMAEAITAEVLDELGEEA